MPYVSPLRQFAESDERDDEPAMPVEVVAREASAAAAPTTPLDAGGPDRMLHVRFGGGSAASIVAAMEAFREIVRDRPGETRVTVHVPGPGGSALPMELRTSVAYDAELLAEIHRRIGGEVKAVELA